MNDDIQSLIDAGSAEQQALLGRLRALILRLYPDARQVIYYRLPTFKTAAGQVSLGYWKEGVTLYTTSPDNLAAFKTAHPKIKTNKASINFRLGDELPLDDVAEVVQRAMSGN